MVGTTRCPPSTTPSPDLYFSRFLARTQGSRAGRRAGDGRLIVPRDPKLELAQLRERVRGLSEVVGGLLPNWSDARTLLIASASAGDDSPAVAAALASLIARAGMGVALVDVDLEHGAARDHRRRGGKPRAERRPARHVERCSLPARPDPARLAVARTPGPLVAPLPPPLRVAAAASRFSARACTEAACRCPRHLRAAATGDGVADAVIVVVALGRTRRDRLADLRNVLALGPGHPSASSSSSDRAGRVCRASRRGSVEMRAGTRTGEETLTSFRVAEARGACGVAKRIFS